MTSVIIFNCNLEKNKFLKISNFKKKKVNLSIDFTISKKLEFLILNNRVKSRYNIKKGEYFCLSKIIILYD